MIAKIVALIPFASFLYRLITIERAIETRSLGLKQKVYERQLLLSQRWNGDSYIGSNREKYKIGIVILKKITI